MAKLIFGCGYLGRRVAELWRGAGERVLVVTRSAQRAAEFRAAGFEPIVADITNPVSLVPQSFVPADGEPLETVLFAVGYDRQGSSSIHDVYVDGLRNAIAALPPAIKRFIYISTTGVYAQTGGEWVDEDSPCHGEREGGQACLAAENLLMQQPLGPRSIVLRFAGIYGPGRIPRREDLLAGRPLAAPADGYLNLIHVDAAAQVVLAAELAPITPRTYLVSDGHPTVRRDYYAEVARLYGAPPPQFTTPDPDSPATKRAASNKRVKNQRMLAELDVRLMYPTYREGLAAIIAAEQAHE